MANANAVSPIADLLHNQLAISRQCAEAVFTGTERIDRVMRGATHRVIADQFQLVEALATTSDPRGFAKLQSGMLNRPDNVAHYAQEVLQAVAEMQSDISHSMQRYMEQMNGPSILAARAVGQAGGTRENASPFNPLTGMFSMWETALKEVTAMADRNLETARTRLKAGQEAVTQGARHEPMAADASGGSHRGAGTGTRK